MKTIESSRGLLKVRITKLNEDQLICQFSDQLAEIRKVSLSSVICKNSEYSKHIQPNAFILPDEFR